MSRHGESPRKAKKPKSLSLAEMRAQILREEGRDPAEKPIVRPEPAPYRANGRLNVEGLIAEAQRNRPNAMSVSFDFERLVETFGTEDRDFVWGFVQQLMKASGAGMDDSFAFMFSVIRGIKPKDHPEAMLAAQMAAVHIAIMTFTRRLAEVQYLPHQDSAERAFNKLTRTFISQMDALKRYRANGEQKVTVRHVSVNEGGKAFVGNVTAAGNLKLQEPANAAPALADARQAEMEIIDERERVPLPQRDEQE